MYLHSWNKLPQAKQMQLAKAYGIKWFGTTEMQLDFELQTKLPKGLLPEDYLDGQRLTPVEVPQIEDVPQDGEVVEEGENTLPNEPQEPTKEVKKRGRKKK